MFDNPFTRKFIEKDVLFTVSWDGRKTGMTVCFDQLCGQFSAFVKDLLENDLQEHEDDGDPSRLAPCVQFWTSRGYACVCEDLIEPDLMITTYKATEDSVAQHEDDMVFEIHKLSTNETKFFRGQTEDGELDASKIWRAALDLSGIHGFDLLGQNCTINGKDYFWDYGEEQIRFFHEPVLTYYDLMEWLKEMSEEELQKEITIKLNDNEYTVTTFDDVTPALNAVVS